MQNTTEHRAVSYKNLYLVLTAVGAVLIVSLLILTFFIRAEYNGLNEAADMYISAQNDALGLTQGSDYLTEQAQHFALTGDPVYVDRYLKEANVTRRRDRAVEDMRALLEASGSQGWKYLEDALAHSNRLMLLELAAFRLGLIAEGADLSAYPQEIREAALTAEELAADAAQQKAAVVEKIFGEEYRSMKQQIYEEVSRCDDELVGQVQQAKERHRANLSTLLTIQYVLMGLILLLILAYIVATMQLIVRPLGHFVQAIRENRLYAADGAQEIRFLAMHYNEATNASLAHRERLSYEATHDPLTGLHNRAAFEEAMEAQRGKNAAFLLVDVDYFKTINDTYGHMIGDKLLQRVAGELKGSFRAEDYVCRIGGDEFAVIMVHADASLKELIRAKIERATTQLKEPEGDCPGVTLSIGVAFADELAPGESLYATADRALYTVKERGRNGFAFYE